MLTLFALLACQDQGLTAHNENPEALITAPEDGAEVVEDIPFELVGVVSDPDDAVADLTVAWFLGSEELCPAVAPDSTGFTRCETTLARGAAEVTLLVLDPADAAGTHTVALTVLSNDAPVVQVTRPETSGVYYSDQPVTLEGTVSDDRDTPDQLVLVWTDGGVDLGLGPVADADGVTSDQLYLDEGNHTLTLTATDTTELTGSDTVGIQVGPANSAPDCEVVAPADGVAFNEGETVTFEGLATDADVPSDWLTATWESDQDGELGSGAASSDGTTVAVAASLSKATHIVSLTVEDEVGASCTDRVVVTIGTPPTLTVTSPSDGDVVNDGDRVVFTATVSDGEDPPQVLDLSWSSDLDGEFSTQGATPKGVATFSKDDLSTGTHILTVTATDTDGFYAQQDLALRVNGLPGAPAVSLSPDPARTTDDLTVSVDSDSVDPEGDTVTYSYAWTVNGTASAASTSAVLSAADTAKGQTWEVSVTPDDGFGSGTPATASITISNSAPALASVALTPDPAVTSDALTCTPGATSDADGDAVSTSITWTVNGTTTSGTGTLPSTRTARGDSVFCTVTPSDGSDVGAAVDSNVVTISNTAPVVSVVTLTPAVATTDTVLSANATTSDDDGDSVTLSYVWTVDGATLAASGSSLDGASWFDKDQDVQVEVTPSDGTDSGTAVASAVVTIRNSPPEAPVVSIDPASPLNLVDDLVCVLDTPSTDADGDGVSYTLAWTVDGSTYSGATTTTLSGDTVPGSDTGPGEVWTCSSTPDDGTDAGTPGTASVTIGCLTGSDASCPAADCATILSDGDSLGDGTYWIDPIGSGAYEVWCDMTTDGGGWTLVSVSSDDGQDTWTWDDRALLTTDTTTFGDLGATHEDFKSLALNEVPFSDVLFVHAPSGDWAAYDSVHDGSSDIGTYIDGVGESQCWDEATDGIPMTAGTITATSNLCTTDLFFNAADADGQSTCKCTECADTHGPAWSTSSNSSCPFDDPGRRASLGPSKRNNTLEQGGQGFGWALDLNTGAEGAAENYVWFLVR